MQNTTTEASPRQAQVAVLLAVLGGALALVALGTMVLRTHSIHAWSDPVNWLTFARNLPTELFTNRFACGYALFLRLILPITGPYWVFLSNLPIIVAVIASAGGVAAVLTPGPPAQKAASALFTIALATVFDPWLVQVMTNPYRDPLSHLFLFGSLLFAARELPHQPWRASRLFVAGLLLGLAYSVREPALLVAIPLAALMIMRARPAGARTLARAAGWALAGALMGALPLLVQSLLREGGGGLLPPQTLAEHRWLPGMHWSAFREIAPQVAQYLFNWPHATLLLALPFALGLFVIARDRNGPAAALLTVPALVYGLFYCFYWTFVPRYVWIAALFGAAVGGVGLAGTLSLFAQQLRHSERLPLIVAALASLLAAGWLFGQRAPARRFRVEDAIALTREVAARVPPGTKVLARRNFCEIIRWFNQLDAYPASWHWAAEAEDPSVSLRERLVRDFAAGREVWCAEVRYGGRRDIEWSAVRRAFDVEPAGVEPLEIAQFGLAPAQVEFWRVRPWSSTSTIVEVYVPQPDMRLEVDARAIGEGARITLRNPRTMCGPPLVECPAVPGANFFALSTTCTNTMQIVLSAPGGVPSVPGIRLYRREEPVLLDFDPTAEPSCSAWLGEGFLRPPYGQTCVRAHGRATVRIPAALLGTHGADLELRWRGTKLDRARSIGLQLTSGPHTTQLRARCDRTFQIGRARAAAAEPGKPEVILELEVLPEAPGHGIELEWLSVRRRDEPDV